MGSKYPTERVGQKSDARIAELEDELKQRDQRIEELKREVDGPRPHTPDGRTRRGLHRDERRWIEGFG